MNIKKRLILSWSITTVIGIVLLFFKNDSTLFSIGVAMIIVNVLRMIKYIPILKNDEKYKELEKQCNDERNIYISRKSYSMAFWLTTVLEAIGIIILRFTEYLEYSYFLGYIICAQLIIYIIIFAIYKRTN